MIWMPFTDRERIIYFFYATGTEESTDNLRRTKPQGIYRNEKWDWLLVGSVLFPFIIKITLPLPPLPLPPLPLILTPILPLLILIIMWLPWRFRRSWGMRKSRRTPRSCLPPWSVWFWSGRSGVPRPARTDKMWRRCRGAVPASCSWWFLHRHSVGHHYYCRFCSRRRMLLASARRRMRRKVELCGGDTKRALQYTVQSHSYTVQIRGVAFSGVYVTLHPKRVPFFLIIVRDNSLHPLYIST